MPEWGNKERVATVNQALARLPHDQIATGLGFNLGHNPQTCFRCRANISMLEIDTILQTHDSQEVDNVA